MLSDISIPLWLTEVDVLEQDPVKRADNLETVMRSAFSTPSVQGMILWSFWNYSSWRGPYTSLVDGNDWQVRENVTKSLVVIDTRHSLDEVEQNIMIYQWRAE